MMDNVLRFDDDRGGLAYPFLLDEWQWQIVSRSFDKVEAYSEESEATGSCDELRACLEESEATGTFGDEDALANVFQAETPAPSTSSGQAPSTGSGQAHSAGSGQALRWVKDDKVMDLYVPGMDTQTFLERAGLRLSMRKGGYVLSKRLSRVMRPYRYWGFFPTGDATIHYDETLDGALWDGCGLVSKAFVRRLAGSLDLTERQRRELLRSGRFEVTTLHEGGQDKGHVLAVDGLAADFIFPAGSAKTELRLGETPFGRNVFIGLNPVHSEDEMCLDIQSIINLYPFFQPEQLLYWMQLESALFLDSIRSGQVANLMGRLARVESAAEMASFSEWHVGDYLLSGGRPMWFAGMVKGVARQHLRRLGSRADKLRAPAPGGRYYIFPAAVGSRNVPAGHIELDPANATAWVNDQDWLEYIVDVLGGCDGDDALWIFPFTDYDGQQRILAWRSPNQLGEYVLLTPTANSHAIAWNIPGGRLTSPHMDSRLLPPRIDSAHCQYGLLTETGDHLNPETSYSPEAMLSTIRRAMNNAGVLGAHCNVLMLCKAVYGRLPDKLPATLEAVIDGSVKTGADLTPVKEWNAMAVRRIVRHGRRRPQRAMPAALLPRLPQWLRSQARQAERHWLDSLVTAMEMHRAQYLAEVEALAYEACPPLAVFEQGRDWLHIGRELRQLYANIMRQAAAAQDMRRDHVDNDDDPEQSLFDAALFDKAAAASERFLEQWPAGQRHRLLLGAMAYLYAEGGQAGAAVRDAVLWQLGRQREGAAGREPGLAHACLDALRQIGLLGEPVWTDVGAVLHYEDAPPVSAGVPVTVHGTWFNLLRVADPTTPASMGQVSPSQRAAAKARIADYAAGKFIGLKLTTSVTDNNRVITRTERGNLFGYVKRDHELHAVRHDQWQIAWAMAVDGNVRAILQPVEA